MCEPILEIIDAIPRLSEIAFKEPICWKISKNENWAVIGANGAGKTVLIDILTGKYALKSGEIRVKDNIPRIQFIKSVSFRDIYSLSDIQNSYYQQRWNAGDKHGMPVVKDLLSKYEAEDWLSFLTKSFDIEDILEKKINLLSSGELRKFLIIRSLMLRPHILILDNPYIGLDADSRIILNEVLEKISAIEGIQIVLVLSNPGDIPPVMTHVLPVKNMQFLSAKSASDFLSDEIFQENLFGREIKLDLNDLPDKGLGDCEFENALGFKNIHIAYGERTILKDLDWEVKKGEKWALLGKNGAGKSTLLSLVCADNPQAYANDITLFDRKRGTGESIWDIKKNIGYISPEMHLYYQKNVRCLDIVGSGFFDTIGLYRKCNPEQELSAEKWMQVFGIEDLKKRPFLTVSSGEQRMVLLTRIFVKNPHLLILDEPLHGLDVWNKKYVKKVIEGYCDNEKSLIYVTHYNHEIPDIVDKRLVLSKRN